MFFLVVGLFFTEILVAITTGSLGMLGDSLHMLSNIIALMVGYYALQYAKKHNNSSMSYGYSRAEVIGALLNSTAMLAICFTIFVEAAKRTFLEESMSVTHLEVLLVVSFIGLPIKIIGTLVFGYSCLYEVQHVSHDKGHAHSPSSDRENVRVRNSEKIGNLAKKRMSDRDMNIQGVWIHMMANLLASVQMIVSVCIMGFAE